MIKKVLQLLAALIICQAAGVIGSLFTSNAIYTWYAELNKPSFNPPSEVFAPVWILLYLMMGISLWLVWQKLEVKKWHFWTTKNKVAYTGIVLFLIQLALNSLWSIFFFGLHNPLAALIVIIELWAMILLTIIWFWRVSKPASILLWPYLGWVSFATVLNVMFVILN